MFTNRSLPRNIIIALGLALIIVIALIALARYLIVRDKRANQKQPAQSASVPDDILRSLTPSQNATTTEISKETLDSLTPPKDAKSVAVDQAILDSLTPPARR